MKRASGNKSVEFFDAHDPQAHRRRHRPAGDRSLESPGGWRTALQLYQKHGWTYGQIAKLYGCHYRTVSKKLKALGAKRHSSPAWHSERGRRLYETWRSMRQRCTNPNHPAYRHYGGRGVDVSSEWDVFTAFHGWALRNGYRAGLSLAQIDRSRDFSPENCRWISEREKRRGRQILAPVNATTTRVRAFGELKTVSQWGQDPRCVVTTTSLRRRLLRGIGAEAAITSRKGDDRLSSRVRKAVISKRAVPKIDWKRVLRLHGERGMRPGDIALRLGVPYFTIQSGLRERLGPLAAQRRMSPTRHRLYQLWNTLRSRTTDPSHPLYSSNGAIGVRVCREWREFEPFLRWAMLTEGAGAGRMLARVRRRGSYSPENCEWVTQAEMNVRRARGLGARKTQR